MARGRSADRGQNHRSASASPVSRSTRQTPRRGNTPRGPSPARMSPRNTLPRQASPVHNQPNSTGPELVLDVNLRDHLTTAIDLPLRTKLTIKRHYNRYNSDAIINYNYSIAKQANNPRSHIPDTLRLVAPENNINEPQPT